MTVTREQVLVEARAWIDTPYQHLQCVRGVAVDCDHMIIGVCRNLGLVAPDFDVPPYFMMPDGVTLMKLCRTYMTEVPIADMQIGDVAIIVVDKVPQHMGILGNYRHGGFSIIHAINNIDRPRVVETRLMLTRITRLEAVFKLPGIE